MQNSLWMRLAALLPLRWFQFMLRPLYIICVRLSRTFFRVARTFSSILPHHGLDDADDLRVGTVDGAVIVIFRHEPDLAAAAAQTLDRCLLYTSDAADD